MTETQLAVLLADVALIIVISRLFGVLARRLGQPAVIGEILGGILVGPTLFDGALTDALFPMEIRPHLGTLANVGLVIFMFFVGLEFDSSRLRGSGRIAGVTAFGSAVLPFVLGMPLGLYLMRTHESANDVAFVLFIGIAVSVTAFPVLARIITDRGMQGSRIAALSLSAAAVCDLAAWTALAAVQGMVSGDGHGWWMLLMVPYALVLFWARPLLRRMIARAKPGSPLPSSVFTTLLVGALASAALTQLIGLHFVIGAFLFGLIVPRPERPAHYEGLLERTQNLTVLLLPMYFVTSGMKVDLAAMGMSDLRDFALVMLVAITGKFGGTWLAVRSQGMPARDSAILATLMNTRGLTELIALGVGLEAGLLDERLYAVFVLMAVITTAMTGPLLKRLTGQGDLAPLGATPPAVRAESAKPQKQETSS